MPIMNRLWLWVILAVALAIRLPLLPPVANPPTAGIYDVQTPDSDGYAELARRVSEGRYGCDLLALYRVPGYPALLSLGVKLIPRLPLMLQVGLDVLLVGLVYVLGTRLFSQRTGLIAAAIQAVTPLAVASSVRVLSDSVFAVVLMASLVAMVVHLKEGRWRSLVAAAVLAGLSCYVRPTGLVMAALMAAALLAGRRRFRRAGAYAGIVLLAVAPWIVRNGVRCGYWGLSTNIVASMHAYSAPKTLAAAEGISPHAAEAIVHRRTYERFGSQYDRQEAARYYRAQRDVTLEILADHPVTYLGLHMRGCLGFWLPGATDLLEVVGLSAGQQGTLGVLQSQGPWAAAKHYFGGNRRAMIVAVPLTLFFVIKLVSAGFASGRGLVVGRLQLPMWAWLMGAMVLVSFLQGGPASTPRFRVPVEGILSLAAAVGGSRLSTSSRRRRNPPNDIAGGRGVSS